MSEKISGAEADVMVAITLLKLFDGNYFHSAAQG
jgi:hypothetical protein